MAENHVKGRGIQGLIKPVSQPVETSQTTPNSEMAPILRKLPFGLPISPKEFCVLKDKFTKIAHCIPIEPRAGKIS